jgi:hypothetical protein
VECDKKQEENWRKYLKPDSKSEKEIAGKEQQLKYSKRLHGRIVS